MARRKTKKPYFVSYEVNTRLGTTKGRKTFDTFPDAQKFAVKVDKQKSAKLIKWGSTSNYWRY